MNTSMLQSWRRTLLSALLSSLCGGGAVSSVVMLAGSETCAASLENVDGEHGTLTVTGQLVDSPCQMSMESRDQSIDLGTLASAELAYPGARSQPVHFEVRLQGCLVASGHMRDSQTDSTTSGKNQPVVDMAFTAPADFSDPSLMKLSGVEGIALRLTDNHNRDVRLGSHGIPQLLAPGDNSLHWKVVAERVPGRLVPGAFRAITDFRLSYD